MKTEAEIVIDYLKEQNPNGLYVACVGQDENLNDDIEILSAIVKGDTFMTQELTDSRSQEAMWNGIDNIMEDIEKLEIGKNLTDLSYVTNSDREEIVMWLWDNDKSDYLGDMLKNTADIKTVVDMCSNYDCINSDYIESGGYSYKESYFGDMVDALNLNPYKVKKAMKKKGRKEFDWEFPNLTERNGKEYVSYDDFMSELNNNTSGGHLVFTGLSNAVEAYNSGDKETVEIPAGNYCGIYNSRVGGGSVMEMKLLRDIEISLARDEEWAKKYDYYSIDVDWMDSYSIQDTYDMTQSFWWKNIKYKKKD